MVVRDKYGNVMITPKTREEYQSSGISQTPIVKKESSSTTSRSIHPQIIKNIEEEQLEQKYNQPVKSTVKPIAQSKPDFVQTRQEYEQKLTPEQYQKSIDTKISQYEIYDQQLQDAKKTIDPMGLYTVEGRDKPISGVELIGMYESMRDEGSSGKTDLLKAREYASGIDPRATIVPTSSGYDIVMPEEVVLDWSKHYLKRSEGNLVSQFGFGVVSSMYALGKPVMDVFGKGSIFQKMTTVAVSKGLNPFDSKALVKDIAIGFDKSKYGIHYLSVFDVGFEPIGWSPKGSTELLGKYPIFTAGGILGEIGQGYAISATLRPVGAGVKTVSRGVVKRVPGVMKKFSSVFPNEQFISGGVRKFGQTTVGKNIGLWSRGYRVGFRLAPGGIKPSEKLVDQGLFKSRFITTKGIEGGKRLERLWLSPEKFTSSQVALNKRLGSELIINFPKSADDISSSYFRSTRLGGIFGNKIITKQKMIYTGLVKSPSDDFVKALMVTERKGVGGGIKRAIGHSGVVDDITDLGRQGISVMDSTGRFHIKTLFDEARPRGLGIDIFEMKKSSIGLVQRSTGFPDIRPGKLDAWRNVFGNLYDDTVSSYVKGASDAASSFRWRHPFKSMMGSEEAVGSLIPQHKTITFTPKINSVFGSGRLGQIARLKAPIVSPSFIFPLALGGVISVKSFQGYLTPTKIESSILGKVKEVDYFQPYISRKTTHLRGRQDIFSDTSSIQKVTPISIPTFGSIITPIQTQEYTQKPLPVILPQYFKTSKQKFPPFAWWGIGFGGGIGGYTPWNLRKGIGYRIRKWKVPSLEDAFDMSGLNKMLKGGMM